MIFFLQYRPRGGYMADGEWIVYLIFFAVAMGYSFYMGGKKKETPKKKDQ